MTEGPRTIDPFLPSLEKHVSSSDNISQNHFSVDISKLPLPCERIPSTTTSLRECAWNEIHSLVARSRSHDVALTPEEEDALDDGFVLCDLNVIAKKLGAWHYLFPRIKPFFALKCNPDVMVAAVLGQYTAEVGFDCASISEIKLALRSTNNNAKRCVYANPQRAETDLDAALALGVEALTFDDSEELRKVSAAHRRRCEEWKNRRGGVCSSDSSSLGPLKSNITDENDRPPQPPEMILRILVPDATSSVPLGEKFGAPPIKAESLAEEALDLGLPVIGVSFHCGSGCHDPEAYGNAIRLAKDVIDVIDRVIERHNRKVIDAANGSSIMQKCTLLDIGGGYPGLDGAGGDIGRFANRHMEGEAEGNSVVDTKDATASQIAAVVTPLVDELFPEDTSPIGIISEPGRYFVEAAFALCCRIYSARGEDLSNQSAHDSHADRRHYYIAQGVHGVFKDVLLCGETFIPIALPLEEKMDVYDDSDSKCLPTSKTAVHDDAVLCPSTVHGPSGEDFDVVCRDCLLPRLKVGDWLIFDNMGAYTLSIAARSGQLPVRYVVGGS